MPIVSIAKLHRKSNPRRFLLASKWQKANNHLLDNFFYRPKYRQFQNYLLLQKVEAGKFS